MERNPPWTFAGNTGPEDAGHLKLAQHDSKKPMTLLIVEDHSESASALAFLLRQEGYRVLVATTAHHAMEIAGQEKVHVVITDLRLPDGDGRELMRTLRTQHQLQGIALSAMSAADDGCEFEDDIFVERLEKPVDFRALFAAIQEAGTSRD